MKMNVMNMDINTNIKTNKQTHTHTRIATMLGQLSPMNSRANALTGWRSKLDSSTCTAIDVEKLPDAP